MYINPDYYLYQKIKDKQDKILSLTEELADANYLNQKLQKKLQQKK